MEKFIIDEKNTIDNLISKLQTDLEKEYDGIFLLYLNEYGGNSHCEVYMGMNELFVGEINISDYVEYNNDNSEYVDYDYMKKKIIKGIIRHSKDRIEEYECVLSLFENIELDLNNYDYTINADDGLVALKKDKGE